MALPAFLAPLAARYRALPRQQQLVVTFGIPVAIFLGSAYMTFLAAKELGPDPGMPAFVAQPGGLFSEITATDTSIADKQKVIDERPRIEAQIDTLKGAIRAAEERLPREAEKASMREVIERLAREIPADIGTVQLRSVRINEADDRGPKVAKNAYRTVTYQTEVLGDMNGIIKYIDSIEKNQRFMTVNSINLKAGDITTDKDGKLKYGLHLVKMDLVTYVYSGTASTKPGTGSK